MRLQASQGKVAEPSRPMPLTFRSTTFHFSSLSRCKRMDYLLGTPTSSSALTARAIFLADEDVSAPRPIRWRSRLGSVRTRLSALPGQHAFLSATLLPIRKVSGIGRPPPPQGSKRLSIDLNVPKWHTTGLFASAGEPVTLALQPGAEKMKFKLRFTFFIHFLIFLNDKLME